MNVFMILDGSYQVDRIETTAPIQPHFAQYELAKNMEYRPSGDFWASIKIGNIETRYRINEKNEFVETKTIDWGAISAPHGQIKTN